ncbi:hypothetical protein MRY58_17345, partial [Escherichia coli]|nr:hypothetical protein [Escherichia coli]MCK3044900.1 hypothetical protein [Escherichia coli]MCK3083403.1 hypothetical protein [Escherichia coli]
NQESRLPPGSDFRRWVWITIAPFVTPVTLDAAAEQPESLAEDPKTLSISCEVTFRHGTLRFNGNVSEKLLTLLIQELKR